MRVYCSIALEKPSIRVERALQIWLPRELNLNLAGGFGQSAKKVGFLVVVGIQIAIDGLEPRRERGDKCTLLLQRCRIRRPSAIDVVADRKAIGKRLKIGELGRQEHRTGYFFSKPSDAELMQ